MSGARDHPAREAGAPGPLPEPRGSDREPGVLRIREARPCDLGRVGEVENACYSTPWSPGAFRSLIGRERVAFLVAEEIGEDGKPGIVGHAILWRVGEEAELANLAVAPVAQGKGVAGAMLDRLLRDARHDGVRSVFLEVRASNHPALALYERRGFREVGVRKQYYERPTEDARVLRLDLARQDDSIHPTSENR